MRTRALLCLVVATAALPSTAGAQGQRAVPVVGGGSFNTAPVLKPGRYSDTIIPAESTFYRVELKKGQRLEIDATFDTSEFERDSDDPGYVPGLNQILYKVTLFTPLRQEVLFDDESTSGGAAAGVEKVSVRSKLAVGYEEILSGTYSDDEFAGPGAYYVGVSTNDLLGQATTPVEIPTELEVRVLGRPQPSSRNYTPPLIKEDAGPSGGGPARIGPLDLGRTRDDGGPEVPTLVAVALFALAGGAALGALAARRPRPSG